MEGLVLVWLKAVRKDGLFHCVYALQAFGRAIKGAVIPGTNCRVPVDSVDAWTQSVLGPLIHYARRSQCIKA
jgi:hypothetical protein